MKKETISVSSSNRPESKPLTEEEKRTLSIRARRRFKAIAWLAHANKDWLMEDEEEDDQAIGDNFKKNIAKSLRSKKSEGERTLSFGAKVILNKAAHLRTDEEKRELSRNIGRLKCFMRYPPSVKEQLPTVMYFAFYGPNRVIIKQNAEPYNMYVIISGQVEISLIYWDKLLKQEVKKVLGVAGAGTIVGEVSLLHGIKRTATLTTLTPCEFLYLKRDDFDHVLKSTVAANWREIQQDMSRFEYFDEWNAMDKREACILSRKDDFKRDEIILGNGIGLENYVHFVTKGFCYVVEVMPLRVFTKKGPTRYELADEKESLVKPQKLKKLSVKEIMSKLGMKDQNEARDAAPAQPARPSLQSRSSDGQSEISPSVKLSSLEPYESGRGVSFKNYELKWHFIKICTFNELSCFNLGENLKNRLIVSGPGTEILYLPRFFMLDKAASLMLSIQKYLRSHIPNTDQIFEAFVKEKAWERYKKELVMETIRNNKRAILANSIHNIPYTIRLANDVGFY